MTPACLTAIAATLPLCLANPGVELERLRQAGVSDAARVAGVMSEVGADDEAADARQAFEYAEWFRRAAALAPNDEYEAEALRRFRAIRLDFVNQPAAWLGYIGEARVHRQAGQLDDADAVLRAVLDEDSDAPAPLRALARLESLEVLLRRDPAQALEQTREDGRPAALWIAARAADAVGEPQRAAELTRRTLGANGVSPHDALALLARTGHATDEEWSRWGTHLAALGRNDDALAAFEQHPAADTALIHGRLLLGTGRGEDAIVRWEDALRDADNPEPLRRATAFAAYDLAKTDATFATLARRRLREVVERTDNDATRAAALHRWARLAEPQQALAVFDRFAETVNTDPTLRYLRITAELNTGSTTAGAALFELAELHDESTSPALDAAILQTRLGLLRDRPREALALLDAADGKAASDGNAAAFSNQRLALLIEAGLIEPARELIDRDNANPDAETLMAFAEALASRHEADASADLRGEVRATAERAVAAAPGDVNVAYRAGAVLHRVGLHGAALPLLQAVDTPESRQRQAEAMIKLGRSEEALALLDRADHADDATTQRLRAALLLQLGRLDDAVAAARSARAAAAPGTDPWWDATCVLAEAQIESLRLDEASRLLRVAQALHPVGSRADLRRRIEALEQRLRPSQETQPAPVDPEREPA